MINFIKRLLDREPKNAEEVATNFVKRFGVVHGLTFTNFNNGKHFRVVDERTIKPKRYIDFWSNGTMRRIDGTYSYVGYRGRLLLEELNLLISENKEN